MRKILICIIIGFLSVSCQDDEIFNKDETGGHEHVNDTITGSVTGMLTIKLQDEIIKLIDNQSNDLIIPTGYSQLDEYLASIGAYKMKRIFPYAGKHEDKQQAEKLNAWYTVWYEEESKVETRSSALNNIFEFIEPVYEPVIEDYKVFVAPNTST